MELRLARRCIELYLVITLVAPAALLATDSATLAGRVVDQDGRPVAEAQLTVEAWRSGQKVVAAGQSKQDGRFVIDEVPVGVRFVLLVDAAEFGREYRDNLFTFPGSATQLGDIPLGAGCVCRGRVIGVDGRPVAGVNIKIEAFRHQLGHTIESFGGAWRVTTDGEGCYVTPRLPVASVSFLLDPPPGSVAPAASFVDISPLDHEMTRADVQLEPEVLLEGTVSDTSGKPIAGAEVWHNARNDEVVKTDSSGRFQLRGCTERMAQRVPLWVSAEGYADYRELEPRSSLPHHVTLEKCRYVNGLAIDAETGEPVKIEKVIVCDVKREPDGTPRSYGCGEARFTLGPSGRFRAAVSTPGEKHLTVMAAGYERGEQYALDFQLLKESARVTIKLRRQGSAASVAPQQIRGVVRSGGKAVAGAWVSLWQKKAELDIANAGIKRGRTVDFTYRPAVVDVLTGADGQYLLDIFDPDSYYVVVQMPGGDSASSDPIQLKAGETRTCDFDVEPGGTIAGQVLGLGPETADGLYLIAFGRKPFGTYVPIGKDGRFVLRHVPVGEIGLKVGHEGYRDAEVARYPFPDNTATTMSEPWKRAVVVTVRPGQAVEGIALDYPAPGPPDSPWEW